MYRTIVFVTLFGFTLARPEPPSAYGAPAPAPAPDYGPPSTSTSVDTGYGVPGPSGGQVFRHVYVHAAPDDAIEHSSRVIRVPGGGNKHVNIIFVKAPSGSSHQQTEVVLPEQPEQKTVVYVLVKKGQHLSDVKVRAPPAASHAKPEVYFIRYKNKEGGGGYGAPAAPASSSYGAPAASVSYGAPAAPASVSYGAPAAPASVSYGTPVVTVAALAPAVTVPLSSVAVDYGAPVVGY